MVEAAKHERGNRRVEIGIVTSDKMNKTRRVEIPRLVKHSRYGKYIKRRTICCQALGGSLALSLLLWAMWPTGLAM